MDVKIIRWKTTREQYSHNLIHSLLIDYKEETGRYCFY